MLSSIHRKITGSFLTNLCIQSKIQYSINSEHLPVITMPVSLKAHLKKLKTKQKIKSLQQRTALSRKGNSTTPIVTCKRSELTHWKGQSYDKFKPIPLASKGWHNRKSNGDYFIIHGRGSIPAFQNEDEGQTSKTFSQLGLSEEMLQALEELGMKQPTNIQVKAIPKIHSGKSVICAAETGSGKTLTYLIPILENIWKYKINNTDIDFNSPLCLILVPSRELAEQVGNISKTLGKKLSLKTKVLVGGKGMNKQMLFNPPVHTVDVLVATIGVLKKVLYNKTYTIDKVHFLVIDEADTMFDDSFNEEVVSFLDRFSLNLQVNPIASDLQKETQLCLIGATLPRDLQNIVQTAIDVEAMEKIYSEHLHCLMPHIPQKFIRTIPSLKPARLLELVKSDLKKKKPVIIFSKNRATSDFVNMFLENNGIPNTNLNGEMNPKFRLKNWEKFIHGEVDVISCTDIGSRGLDTVRVQHVINYDFPSFMSDYIHRAGRTGRVGSTKTGHVTSFISYGYEIELLHKIEIAARKSEELPNVNANIKRKLSGFGEPMIS